ncbi:MAG: DUF2281 domain-containing protein [Tildeniella nuda ZEHNDER 1965/U140]|jgi:hypothetical protein|nr:DUF2281 domain-containing protein [Tildeniella nuda ZEHNDER 1965/U140]
MQPIQQRVVEGLQTLSSREQQEVLDFVEFLRSKQQHAVRTKSSEKAGMSVLEAAGEYVGCLEGGRSDLSTNKAYMEGFGEDRQ